MKDQVFYDSNEDKYDLDFIADQDGSGNTHTYANFLHVSVIATFFASQLSLAIAVAANPVLASRLKNQVDADLVKICTKSTDARKEMSGVLADLKACGLVFAPQETPLQVIASARRSRFPSLNTQDNYFAMQGVLALGEEFGMYGMDDSRYYDPVPAHRKEFFRIMIKKYQWQMLQLAKCSTDSEGTWGAVSLGHFELIASFYEGFIVNKVAQQAAAVKAVTPWTVPFLTYNPTTDELVMNPLAVSGKKTFPVWKMPADITSTHKRTSATVLTTM